MPILLLYFSLTASVVLKEARIPQAYTAGLVNASRVLAVLFYLAQIVAAWYMTRTFFPPSASKLSLVLQYIATFIGSLFCSLCGAVACEAFGYVLFLRVMRRGM